MLPFSNEAIEAAAQQLYSDLSATYTKSLRWSLAREPEREMFRSMARKALLAAHRADNAAAVEVSS
jgi:hypothetical protein